MPLRYAAEPANGTDLIRAGLNRLSTRPNRLSDGGADLNALQVTQPHAVYDLRADAVANGGGLESAVFSGFRYLVGDGDTSLAAAEVQTDAAGNATLLANLDYGPFVAATAQALPRVAALAPVNAGSPTRSGRCGLRRSVSWRSGSSPRPGGARHRLPARSAPPGLQADRPYSADDFIRPFAPGPEAVGGKRGQGSLSAGKRGKAGKWERRGKRGRRGSRLPRREARRWMPGEARRWIRRWRAWARPDGPSRRRQRRRPPRPSPGPRPPGQRRRGRGPPRAPHGRPAPGRGRACSRSSRPA